MLMSAILSAVLIMGSVAVHYEGLRLVSGIMPNLPLRPRTRLLFVLAAVLIMHLIEVCLYAVGFMFMHFQLGIGGISGALEGGWDDFFYFSASTYTTLGMGDITPTGAVRSVAAVQSLVGLVLIGWSTSFTYLAMREFWGLHESPRRST